MEASDGRKIRQRGRQIFRLVRITVWLLLLAALSAGLYLNLAGLPDLLKRPLLEELHRRGFELGFTRLRLSWHRGLVAENVALGLANAQAGPRLSAAELQIRPRPAALARLKFDLAGVVIRRGRVVWQFAQTNQQPAMLQADDVEIDMHFLPDDRWTLNRFEARFAGAQFQIGGTLAHASAIRDWTIFRPNPSAPASQLETLLRRLATTLSEVRFDGVPRFRLDVHGDARAPHSFSGFITAEVCGAETPWGTLTNATASAHLSARRMLSGLPPAKLEVRAQTAQTRHVCARNFALTANFTQAENCTNVIDARLELAAADVATDWGGAGSLKLSAQWLHSLTNPIPASGRADLCLFDVKSPRGNARSLCIYATGLQNESARPRRADPGWSWWTNLEPFVLDVRIQGEGIESPELQVDEIRFNARWLAPELVLTNLYARLYGGELHADANLDVATQQAGFRGVSDFDVRKLSPLLTEAGRIWLGNFAWQKPPQITVQGSAILPAWTNRQPDWRAEVQPTVRLEGALQSGPASFRGVQVSAAQSHFFYSNRCWYLPDLHIVRPEGRADLVHTSSDATHEIYWRIKADIDPRALEPLMDERTRRVLGSLELAQPPHVEAEVWAGRRDKLPRRCVGQIALSNFTFRGQAATSLQTAFVFTNQTIDFFSPVVTRADGVARADGVRVDITAERVFLTNGFSTTDPMAIARAIGPNAARTLSHYQFLRPPVGRVNGVVPFRGTKGADIVFELEGGPFCWWRFNLPRVAGTVHWVDDIVTVNVAEADFYGGRASGVGVFDSSPAVGTDFRFDAILSDANLQSLMHDISTRTNRLEGLLTGRLTVDSANSEDWESWQGRGEVVLRDGYVWELPLFSIFSPLLNSVVPGLGSSRFSSGTANFIISNSVIRSEDLELRAPLLRMKFRGSVDFHERVNSKVEAELLRDAWLIGPLVSTALRPLTKIFEYEVTGTLSEPKAQPLYVPKALLLPLQPFRLFKSLFPGRESVTNAPSEIVPDDVTTNAPPKNGR